MNNSNYPLRVSKNKTPFRFSKRLMMEQKINEENIKNNHLVFSIDPRKALQSNQYQDFFRNTNKIRLFSISDLTL